MGGLFSYFRGLLGAREMRILILGLDGAGKTTILYKLQVGEVVTTIPTIGFNVEQVTYKNLKFQVWDLGGQTSIRPYWRCYYGNTDAIIYVVDSADRDRIGISKDELVHMLREDELSNAILVVLANKQDMAGCLTVAEDWIKRWIGFLMHCKRGNNTSIYSKSPGSAVSEQEVM
ncbi:unnamed protein product [Pieris brassicae]|uniref:ADP-ribosylation factor-like protein 1 n=1 Tax=Pieris brassicae TaxID=7116 RepID=A0A9P0TPJ6_PIEBR|nr:unnamed protein product [Pieris brassicae]